MAKKKRTCEGKLRIYLYKYGTDLLACFLWCDAVRCSALRCVRSLVLVRCGLVYVCVVGVGFSITERCLHLEAVAWPPREDPTFWTECTLFCWFGWVGPGG